MFAIEISFADGVSQPETILVRRPQALIGATDYAHVVIDDLRDLNYQIRLIRELGRRFRAQPVSTTSEPTQLPPGIEGVYEGSVALNLGKVRMQITALDIDLQPRENEPPDRAGVRTLRQACALTSPQFPAVVVRGGFPMVVSFAPEHPVYIGRSKQCAVRLDSADISARHARMGFENGEFWIEDLGSTNGTFVHNQQISGPVSIRPGVAVVVGREVSIVGVTSEKELIEATHARAEAGRQSLPERRYPIIYSLSDSVRPAKVVLVPGMSLTIGRDLANDICVGVPHVSRRHCTVIMDSSGAVRVVDSSRNGTAHGRGLLQSGQTLEVGDDPTVLDLGGVTLGLCFSAEDERAFVAAQGSSRAFLGQVDGLPPGLAGASTAGRVGDSGEYGITGTGTRTRKPTQVLNDVVDMYNHAGRTGRMVLIAFSVVLILVVAVIVNLFLPMWFR